MSIGEFREFSNKPVVVELHMYGHISVGVISEMSAVISEKKRCSFPENVGMTSLIMGIGLGIQYIRRNGTRSQLLKITCVLPFN